MDHKTYCVKLNDGNLMPALGFGTARKWEVRIMFVELKVNK